MSTWPRLVFCVGLVCVDLLPCIIWLRWQQISTSYFLIPQYIRCRLVPGGARCNLWLWTHHTSKWRISQAREMLLVHDVLEMGQWGATPQTAKRSPKPRVGDTTEGWIFCWHAAQWENVLREDYWGVLVHFWGLCLPFRPNWSKKEGLL